MLDLIIFYTSLKCSLKFYRAGYNTNMIEMVHESGIIKSMAMPDDHMRESDMKNYLDYLYQGIKEENKTA